MNLFHTFLLLFLGSFLLGACNFDSSPKELQNVIIRLDAEPDRIHPLLSRTIVAKTIERHLFSPLLDFDPQTLALIPVLAKALPIIEPIEAGALKGGVAYTFEIRVEARWDNGMPILAEDYVFTMKALLNPAVRAASYRAYLNFLKDIKIDPNNPRRFTIYTDRPYILAEAALGNLEIYPQYFYDKKGVMDSYAIKTLADPEKAKDLLSEDDRLRTFGKRFNEKSSRTASEISGSGAYQLERWLTGEEVVLKKKENWWGTNVENASDLLTAIPNQLIFKIIPDAVAATSLLKSGVLDVMTNIPADLFLSFQSDAKMNARYQFFKPDKLLYYYIGLNGNDFKLSDKNVRKALAHLIDVDEILNTVGNGLGRRLTNPIHPAKPYYNEQLPVIDFDIDRAKELLAKAGWNDSNRNGIVDRLVDGELLELTLTFKYKASNQVAENVGLLLKKNARIAGVEIELDGKEFNTVLKEYRKREFDLVYLAWIRPPILDDLRQTWHTSSNQSGGSNRTGFGNTETDAIIDQIRITYDQERRKELYLRIQELIYEEQPYIFLYSPQETMAIHRRFSASPSIQYPGFFPNAFKPSVAQ